MAAPIFRNRSYVFGLGLDPQLTERASQIGGRLGFRFMPFADFKECQEGATKTNSLVCILVGSSISSEEKQALAKVTESKVYTLGAGADLSTSANFESEFQQQLAKDVPVNFKKIGKLGLETAVSSMSPGVVVTFSEDYSSGPTPEALIYCDLVDGTLFFRGQIEFSFANAAGSLLGQIPNEAKLVDYFKEISNLVMGIVSHNMRKLGLEPRGGVPYFADMRNAEAPKFTNYFWGGQFSCAELQGVKVRLGYFDSAKSPLPDFNSIEVDTPDSEVEFL